MKQKLIEQLNTKNQRLSEINFQLMKINLAIKTWWSSIKARASNSPIEELFFDEQLTRETQHVLSLNEERTRLVEEGDKLVVDIVTLCVQMEKLPNNEK